MIKLLKKRWKPNADKAWQIVSERLLADGLMRPELISGGKKLAVRRYSLRWIAAAAALCALAVGMTLWWMGDAGSSEFISMYNENNDEFIVVKLEDGSTAYLARNSRLSYPEIFPFDHRKVRLEGDAFFEVQPDLVRPFIIETQYASVEVLGTAFHLCSGEEAAFAVSVKSGKVQVVMSKTADKIEVEAGEWFYVESGRWQKQEMGRAEAPAQCTGVLHFKDECLAEIIRVVNLLSVSEKSLVLADEVLAEHKLTLSLTTVDPTEVAVLICSVLGLLQLEQDNTINLIEGGGERFQ